jgi:long-chain acyl-CoA synthetase
MTENIASLFYGQVESNKGKTALRRKKDGSYIDIKWEDYGRNVRKMACALINLGLKEGDRVAIFSYNCPEWAYMDLAALSLRAVVVPIYFKSNALQVEFILRDSKTSLIMVGDESQLAVVNSIRDRLPDLKKVIYAGEKAPAKDPAALTVSSLLAGEADKTEAAEMTRRIGEISPDDIATLVYTSGTTGEPKGVMLSHKNLLANVRSDLTAVSMGKGDVGLSFLPTSHVLDRVVVHYMNIVIGGTVAYAGSLESVLEDIQLVRPTAMCGVPRMFEKIYSGILDRVNSGPAMQKKLFHWAVGTGSAVVNKRAAKKPISPWLKLNYALADALIFVKIRKLFGGRMKLFASGGAYLQEEIDIFFRAIGIPIMHGYGLTEATCTVTLNTRDDFKPGTLGRPLLGVKISITGDEEILVRGNLVMKGYYNRPEDSSEALEGGWLHTGDMGYIDGQGYLVMTDRKKDILVTSGGKNISPQRLETLLRTSRFIEQAVIIAERRRFVSALIVPDFLQLRQYCLGAGIEYSVPGKMVKEPEIIKLYEAEVDKVNSRLDSYEKIKSFVLMPQELTAETGELTYTLKVKRRVVDEKYRAIIDKMYDTKSHS